MRRDFYHLQQKVICDRQVGKEKQMKNENNYFDTNSIDDIRYGDTDSDLGDKDSARVMYLSAIAKALVEIRDELRKMNEGREKDA